MISIQTNTDSLIAQQNLNINHNFQSKTIQQLTSGYRINSSADDAAGLAVANAYRSQVTELTQGVSNANNGVSQLQIVDGGLSNISTILDRMKTLATESASQTFTGNRSVLNQEYTGLLSEINRQATNVNLNAGGSFNTNLSVYIGGANTSTNAAVKVDLSGSTNAVDSTSLGLSASSVLGGGASVSGNTQNLNTTGATFVKSTGAGASDNQVFTFNTVDSTGATKQVQATIAATASGSTLNQVLTSLNSQLNASGISAGVDANGALQFSGSASFTVSDNAAQAPSSIKGFGSSPAVTSKSTGSNLLTNEVPSSTSDAKTGTAENTSNYLFDGAAAYVAPSSGSTETISFTNTAGNTFTAKLDSSSTGATSGDTLAHALSSINAQTSSYGVYAVANSAGTGISFQSANAFSIKDSAISSSALSANDKTATGTPLTGLTNFTSNTSTLGAYGSNAAAPTTYNFASGGASLSAGGGSFLTGTSDKQTFTFNIAGVASGASVGVDITHADVTSAGDEPTLLAAIQTKVDTVLGAADPKNYTAGDIKVGVDTSGFLSFSSSASSAHPNALFSVSAGVATTAATGLLTNTAAKVGLNNQAQSLDATYTANTGADTSLTVGGTSLTITKNASVATAISQINTQLATAGNKTVFASLDDAGTGINFQSINKVNVGGSTLAVTTSTNAYLDTTANAGDKQSFTFNVAGQSSPITLTLAGKAGGYTGASAVTALNTLLATAPYTALRTAGISAVADSNGALSFKSGTATGGTAFTVTDNHDSAGDGLTSYANGNSNFTGINTYNANATLSTYNQTYVAPTGDTTLVVGKTNVSLAAGDNVSTAVSKINSALQAAGNSTIVAAVNDKGDGILYQQNGTGTITLGGSSAGTVFSGSTSATANYSGALGTGDGIASTANANAAINAINSAISALGLVQGSIGAGENKLQYAINLAQSQISSFSSAQSQIRDTDVAAQAANLTKSQVLTQTSIAAMAQANSEPQSILKLLQ